MSATVRKGRQPDPTKDEAILDAAKVLFAERGYGVSVDEIAAAACVSKQTIYARYAGKQDLLAAVVHQTAEDLVRYLEKGTDDEKIETALIRFGEKLYEIVIDPRRIAMQRLLIAESIQFPELAERYYASGPAFVRERLSELFARNAAAGDLVVGDPVEAAAVFVGLVIGSDQIAALMGALKTLDAAERRRRVRRAVDAFLKIHGAYRKEADR